MKKVKKSVKAKKTVKVDGKQAKPRLDKFARGGGVKKGHKTQVNIIIGGGAKPTSPALAPPAPPSPMGGMPMGGPPMQKPPGMKSGGKVKKLNAGSGSGVGRLEKSVMQKTKK